MKMIEIKLSQKQIIEFFLKIYIIAIIGLITLKSYFYLSDIYFDYGYKWYYTEEYLEVIAEYALTLVFLLTFLKLLNTFIEAFESMNRFEGD